MTHDTPKPPAPAPASPETLEQMAQSFQELLDSEFARDSPTPVWQGVHVEPSLVADLRAGADALRRLHAAGQEQWPPEQVYSITVFREEDGRYAADYRADRAREGGMGEYAATPIGALAELCATLLKVEEDKRVERAEQRIGEQGDSVGRPAGEVGGILYCYGGCGRMYRDFESDVSLPTPLWNRIAVGPPFDEMQTGIDRDGRGGVLCPACIVKRLAALPGRTVIKMDID